MSEISMLDILDRLNDDEIVVLSKHISFERISLFNNIAFDLYDNLGLITTKSKVRRRLELFRDELIKELEQLESEGKTKSEKE